MTKSTSRNSCRRKVSLFKEELKKPSDISTVFVISNGRFRPDQIHFIKTEKLPHVMLSQRHQTPRLSDDKLILFVFPFYRVEGLG